LLLSRPKQRAENLEIFVGRGFNRGESLAAVFGLQPLKYGFVLLG
jgi:hypothetical protein